MNLNLGLTGGIGAGKTTVANFLVDHGAVLIDADVLAREVVEPGTHGLKAVVERFGSEILTVDEELDRPALGAKVFSSEEARLDLNSILHPLIRERSQMVRAEAVALNPDAVIIEDIPLLAESGQAGRFHGVILVHTDKELRIQRLIGRGLSRDEAVSRIKAQASEEERREIADVLIKNNQDLGDLQQEVRRVWNAWVAPYSLALSSGQLSPETDVQQPGAQHRLLQRLRYIFENVGDVSPTSTGARIDLSQETSDLGALLDQAGIIQGPHGWVSASPGNNELIEVYLGQELVHVA